MSRPWKPLTKGDVVDVIAPGFGAKPRTIEACKKQIESLGLTPRIPDDILGDDPFSSNDFDYRLDHLYQSLTDDSSSAIWCLKGGYGTAELMPELMKKAKPKQQKLVIGYSDITALHSVLNHQWGWASLHAPVVWQLAMNLVEEDSLKQLRDVMFGEQQQTHIALTPMNDAAKNAEKLTSTVTGGNMMLVQSGIKTPWELVTRNRIVFLEDIDERPYRIARMLVHMEQAGLFEKARALVLGQFTAKDVSFDPAQMETALEQCAARLSIPVYRTHEVGHEPRHVPLPLNTQAVIHWPGDQCTLTCEAGYAS